VATVFAEKVGQWFDYDSMSLNHPGISQDGNSKIVDAPLKFLLEHSSNDVAMIFA
jgi:hypothetical protein